MTPWTIDADDIQEFEELDRVVQAAAPQVKEFLTAHQKCFVVGTKGLGKTFLLKMKRFSLHENICCIPKTALLDKPAGDPIFSRDVLALLCSGTDVWKKLWLLSIGIAASKAIGLSEGLELKSKRLLAVVESSHLQTVQDHLVKFFQFSPSELFKAFSDFEAELIPRLRGIQATVALFIDSVDEYFNKHLLAPSAMSAGETSPAVWYHSQIGLVEAVYQLRRLTHHLKVYAAIRKEAFARISTNNVMFQQYQGSAVDITYDRRALRLIFESNVLRENPDNLCLPGLCSQDPITAFFGIEAVKHHPTGRDLPLFDYVLRHTLHRPRDLMLIGGRISQIAPVDRNEGTIKREINLAGTDIAREYLCEKSPELNDVPISELFVLLDKNVLDPQDIEALRNLLSTVGNPERDIFSVLYSLGLLGVVSMHTTDGKNVQKFLKPGDNAAYAEDVFLPDSSAYVMHPILSELIQQRNQRYATQLSTVNIAGDGLPWGSESSVIMACVLKADIQGFSRFMGTDYEATIKSRLEEMLKAQEERCIYATVEGGDSITLICAEPRDALKMARTIMEELDAIPGACLAIRVAVDRGQVAFSRDKQPLGLPLRVAARIEPLISNGGRSAIWVTESFRDGYLEAGRLYNFSFVGKLNIRKPNSSEADEFVELYQVVS